MRSEKGITLVALILIILLLLVLAGLTVALVLSNENEAPVTNPGTVVETPVVDDTVTSENDNNTTDVDAPVDADGDATPVDSDVEPAA